MDKKDLLIKYHSHDYTPLIKISSHKKQKFKQFTFIHLVLLIWSSPYAIFCCLEDKI